MRVFVIAFFSVAAAFAQDFTQRGFFETRAFIFTEKAPNDSAYVVGDGLFRYEMSRKLLPGLTFHGGLDARTDTHWQTERSFRLDVDDRRWRRPSFSVRRLSLEYHRGPWTLEAGRQFIRWGKTDILTPTDRFAPRDFLNVVDNEFLSVPAGRVTFEKGGTTVDAVYQARFIPSRIPLLNQRWTVLQPPLSLLPINQYSRFPGGGAYGLRINHVGRGYDASISAYDGYNHLPLFDGFYAASINRIQFERFYPRIRTYGADFAVPLSWFTLKGEAAWFTTKNPAADEYVLWVGQLERQTGEWLLVGGYAGETVTKRRSPFQFAPDRGLTRAFIGRASYTIDVNRSLAFEFAVRQNGRGVWVKSEYSQAMGNHFRVTAGFTVIRGHEDDFLGQYHRNSHALLALRYSF